MGAVPAPAFLSLLGLASRAGKASRARLKGEEGRGCLQGPGPWPRAGRGGEERERERSRYQGQRLGRLASLPLSPPTQPAAVGTPGKQPVSEQTAQEAGARACLSISAEQKRCSQPEPQTRERGAWEGRKEERRRQGAREGTLSPPLSSGHAAALKEDWEGERRQRGTECFWGGERRTGKRRRAGPGQAGSPSW